MILQRIIEYIIPYVGSIVAISLGMINEEGLRFERFKI